jgi:hypothetical protein
MDFSALCSVSVVGAGGLHGTVLRTWFSLFEKVLCLRVGRGVISCEVLFRVRHGDARLSGWLWDVRRSWFKLGGV